MQYNEPPLKKRKLESTHNFQEKPPQYHQEFKKRKSPASAWSTRSCAREMAKKQKISEYWSGRTAPRDKYDFLIISSMSNCIYRYIT